MHDRHLEARGQGDGNLGAQRLGAADVEPAAVQLHQRLGDRQAEPGAFAPARAAGVDLGEGRQRDRDLVLGHADPGVAHAHGGAAVARSARFRRVTVPPGGREPDGVADQVAEHLAQLGGIALDRRQRRIELAFQRDAAARCAVGLKEASDTCRTSSRSTSRASSVYLPLCILEMSRMSLMTASRCVAASRMRSAYSTISLSFSRPLLVLAEQLGEADHRVERRPQLMAHVGDEFGLDLARQLASRCAPYARRPRPCGAAPIRRAAWSTRPSESSACPALKSRST